MKEQDNEFDLVRVYWHKDTGWMIECPILNVKLDSLTLIELSNYLNAIDVFVSEFNLKEL